MMSEERKLPMSYSCLRFLPEIIFSTLEQGEETQAEHTELKKKQKKEKLEFAEQSARERELAAKICMICPWSLANH